MQIRRRPRFAISRLNAFAGPQTARARHGECSSSLMVLAAVGVLVCAAPGLALAQSAGTVLPRGTVPVLRGVVAGAMVGAPTATPTGNSLTITQQQNRAIIDWHSFNIANGSEVRFIQPSALASALNRIYSADPSIIQGKLSANGQILLINQNGILFDRGAQINVNSLVASTLNISNDAFARGLTAGGNTTPAFEGGYQIGGNGSTDPALRVTGAVRIGAHGDPNAPAPEIRANPGGNIMVFAPVIDNRNGLITSPDGQVVLAAGSKAYLTDVGAEAQGIRGVLVEVSADEGPVELTSLVRNLGTITADRGNVTLAGLAINQSGRVSASTAVLYDGSVWLKAGSKRQAESGAGLVTDKVGKVELAAGSVTETPLDTTDTTRISETTDYASSDLTKDRRGSIRIDAGTIEHRGTIRAPGGRIDITATNAAAPTEARIYLDEGSVITAAGNWADVDYASNLATFRVTSNELKDSPLQKDGVLRGQTVTVDLRKGSEILDVSGYQDARLRSVAEKAAVGGDVTLSSGGSVVQRSGSVVDVSGGGYVYDSGRIATTQILGADGKRYDIGTASKDRSYSAVLDSYTREYGRWGQTIVYNQLNVAPAVLEAGYVEGQRGGNLTIKAPSGVVLDGSLKGGATAGPRQLSNAPRGGTLTLGQLSEGANVLLGNVTFASRATDTLGASFTATTGLTEAQRKQLTLGTDTLFGEGSPRAGASYASGRFDKVEINASGLVTLPADVTLEPGVESTLTLRGQQIDVAGRIQAASGTVNLQTVAQTGAEATAQPLRITVHSGASISTAGQWLNNASRDGASVGPELPSATAMADGSTPTSSLNGGNINLSSQSVDLQLGSTLDVSGGGRVARNNAVTGGAGGAISISAFDPAQQAPDTNRFAGELRGYALGAGGSLSIALGQIQIGGGVAPVQAHRFDAEFFNQGGFRSFDLSGAFGLTVTEGTRIEPQVRSWRVDPLAAAGLASGGDLASVARREVLPAHEQQRPSSVALRATAGSAPNAKVEIQEGAAIVVSPGGSITVEAKDGVEMNGLLQAQGGQISLVNKGPARGSPSLHLGGSARVIADGTFVAKPNDAGLRQGTLLGGGTVTISTTNTSVTADAGSLISVDGSSSLVDRSTQVPTRPYEQVVVNADAGSVLIKAQDEVHLDGRLSGRAPGAQSAGGSFSLELTNRKDLDNAANTDLARRIIITQAPAQLAPEAGHMDASLNINGLRNGGFDKVRLAAQDKVELRGPVSMDFQRGVWLDAPELKLASGQRVDVNSTSVVLANSFGRPSGIGSDAIENGEPSVLAGTSAGTGVLNVSAKTLDLYGDLTLNGVRSATLSAEDDLRLTGRVVGSATSAAGARLTGSLTTTGDLTLRAAQVYPTTQSEFKIAVAERAPNASTTSVVDSGTITVAGNGRQGGAVYSAGGKLTLQADNIVQAGVLKAPLGEISLDAKSSLDLASASLTSVSAAGTLIPYGYTVSGVSWLYGTTNANATTNDIKAAPEKRITLAGASVNQDVGAIVDVAGGGDIVATEFVPGSGGSKDVLVQPNTYAIIPAARLAAMPVDGDIAKLQDPGFGTYTANKDRAVYNSIHIGAGSIVPEGDYVLLPGRYALLPGAYMVQLQTGAAYTNMPSGSTQTLLSGRTVVSGYRTVAGTPIRDSNTVGVVVRPGSDARKESDYVQADSSFFAKLAALERRSAGQVAADAGALSIGATEQLRLAGTVNTAPGSATSRAAEVDLTADRIALVDRVGQDGVDSGYLQIETGTLSRIQGSVLVGGTRSSDGANVRVTAGASNVLVANTEAQPLQAPELLIAARSGIEVRNGSVLSGVGTGEVRTRDVIADAGGALIRLSSGSQVTVDRGATPDAGHGTIDIQSGATLNAGKSMLLDATRATTSRGTLNVNASGSLSLAAGSIALGDGTAPASAGLALSNDQLRQYSSLDALTLKSYGSIDLLGAAEVGTSALKQLTLDTSLLQGVQTGPSPQAAHIRAGSVTLLNSTGATARSSSGGNTLDIDAASIRVSAGDKAVGGYSQLTLNATGDVVNVGEGSLRAGGDLTVRSARIVSESGARQAWRAVDDSQLGAPVAHGVTLAANPLGAGAGMPTALGSSLAVEGQSIVSNARIVMSSGSVALSATGGGVQLTEGGVIDVRGAVKDFNGVAVATGGGSATLSAAGDVRVDTGAAIRLDGTAQGGDAGRLEIAARGLRIDGDVSATAAAGQAGGRSKVDVQTLTSFSALNQKLEAGGFNDVRELRVRQGDLAVGVGDAVTAHQIVLSADAGRIDINGTLDASRTAGGGSVSVHAQNGLRVGGTALIDASGRSTDAAGAPSNGGRVQLDTRSGTLEFADSGRIDVRAGEAGKSGQVTFTAARTAGNDGVDVNLRGTVLSQRHAGDAAGEVTIEARRVYSAPDTSEISAYGRDHAAFMGRVNAPALKANLKGDDGQAQANTQVRGAVEVQASGDFFTSSDWVLTTSDWMAGAAPGTLTIRAVGDLTLAHAIGLPNDDLYNGKTWNIRLVGGADLGAANALAVARPGQLDGKGNVTLDWGAKVRTGTGSIDIAAGRDFVITNNEAVVYTSGVAAASNPASTLAAPNPAAGIENPWVAQGGSIRINAQNDAVGTQSDQSINDWLRRPRGTVANARLSGWWAYRPNFRGNVASFGGGDIEIAAGRNVDNLSAMSATSGRVTTENGVRQLEVQGGGNLLVQAGGNVLGGEYLVGRGTGVIRAGGKVGIDRDASGVLVRPATQLYLMGESSDPSLKQASMRIQAVGDVAIQSVDNPTVLPIEQSSGPGANFGSGSSSSYFFTYAQNSSVDIASLTGGVVLGSVPLAKPYGGYGASRGSAYPAYVSAVAFDGSIKGLTSDEGGAPEQAINLLPSATGGLRLLAGRDISGLNMVGSDRHPDTVSSWRRNDDNAASDVGNVFLDTDLSTARLVLRPRSAGYVYDVQARDGSIGDSKFNFPAVSRIRAGTDVSRVEAILQNLSADDASLVQADSGEMRPGSVSIGGPGRLVVQSGGTAEFQSPLTAEGNLRNPSLPAGTSARLTVIAGVKGNLDLAKLDAAYAELIEAGKAKDDARAQAAMREFLGSASLSEADIRSFLTSIETLGGSDIDLLAPRGNITVGLTTPRQGTTGVVTNAGGAIRSYLEGDFNINRGKVVTALGGDILIYTSKGNIDAGRGAKTSTTTPAPQRVPVVDPETNVITGYRYLLPTGVAGSGIQTVTSDPDGPGPLTSPKAGSVYLFAPSGFVDAGEAGIVSGANIFIAAQVVLNASNISSAGSSVGVPVAEAGSLASSIASSGAPTSAGNKGAEDPNSAAAGAARAAAGVVKPNILTVEVMGFGDKNCKEQEKDCFAK